MTSSLRRVVGAVAIVAVAGLAACSSDDSSSSSTCSSLQDLASQVRALTDVNLRQEGTDGVSSAVDDVRSAAQQAKQDASKEFGDDIDAVESAVDDLRSTIADGRGDQSLAEWVSTLGNQVGAVGDAFSTLDDTVTQQLGDCDLSGS